MWLPFAALNANQSCSSWLWLSEPREAVQPAQFNVVQHHFQGQTYVCCHLFALGLWLDMISVDLSLRAASLSREPLYVSVAGFAQKCWAG